MTQDLRFDLANYYKVLTRPKFELTTFLMLDERSIYTGIFASHGY
jgi:hypothetical protein